MGLSFGGTAFGIGIGSMAVAGGIVGLGAYGFAKMFSQCNSQDKLAQNLLWLEEITREYHQEKNWCNLEIETELKSLKATVQKESMSKILADLKKADEAIAKSSFIPFQSS